MKTSKINYIGYLLVSLLTILLGLSMIFRKDYLSIFINLIPENFFIRFTGFLFVIVGLDICLILLFSNINKREEKS